MADNQPDKAKRVVKSPETFRERALKASDDSDKPQRAAELKRVSGNLVRPVTSPIAQAAQRVANFKPLRPLTAVLRFVGKIIFPVYFRQSWRELRQVTWPTLKQSRQLTFAVLVFAASFGAVIAVVDFGLDKLFRNILLK